MVHTRGYPETRHKGHYGHLKVDKEELEEELQEIFYKHVKKQNPKAKIKKSDIKVTKLKIKR